MNKKNIIKGTFFQKRFEVASYSINHFTGEFKNQLFLTPNDLIERLSKRITITLD